MDQLDSMRVFVTVADAQSFAGAARLIKCSPAAVTRAVAALEQHLGARLLHRTTRSVRLSEAGDRYVADCRRILAALQEADGAASGAHVEPQGHLMVTAPVLFGRIHIAPLLLDFLELDFALSNLVLELGDAFRCRAVVLRRFRNPLIEGADLVVAGKQRLPRPFQQVLREAARVPEPPAHLSTPGRIDRAHRSDVFVDHSPQRRSVGQDQQAPDRTGPKPEGSPRELPSHAPLRC